MDKNYEGSIGERVRKVRQEAGLTQKAFGKELGVSLPTINRIENDQRSPDAGSLVQISSKFKTDLNWLLTGSSIVKHKDQRGLHIPLLKKLSGNLIDNPEEDVAALLCIPDVPASAVACKSSDDACAPEVMTGDIVVFIPGDCEVGGLALVCDEWGKGLVRKKQKLDSDFVFVADHRGYERLRDGDVTCLGAVWGTIRSLMKK